MIFGATVLGSGVGSLLSLRQGLGVAFVIGCVLSALSTRPADLLPLTLSPPLVFFIAVLFHEIVSALGGPVIAQSVIVGLVNTLATAAPSLFLGTLLVAIIALPRGLPARIRELRNRPAGADDVATDDTVDDHPVRWDIPPRRRPYRDIS